MRNSHLFSTFYNHQALRDLVGLEDLWMETKQHATFVGKSKFETQI
jgi:hypothetical protein